MRNLAPRERQISRLLKLGWKPRHIAIHLEIASGTVYRLRKVIIAKKGIEWFTGSKYNKIR